MSRLSLGTIGVAIFGSHSVAPTLHRSAGTPAQGCVRGLTVRCDDDTERAISPDRKRAERHHGLHTGHLKSGGLEWSAWVDNAATRYPRVQGRPYHTLVVSEAGALALLTAVIAWRVGWFIYTRPRRLTPSGAHGTARWMTRREMKKLAYKGTPLLLGRRGGVSVAMNRGLQVLNTLVIGPIGSGKTSGVFGKHFQDHHGNHIPAHLKSWVGLFLIAARSTNGN